MFRFLALTHNVGAWKRKTKKVKHISVYTKDIKRYFADDTRTLEEKSLDTLRRIAKEYFNNDIQEALLTLVEHCEKTNPLFL